MIIDISKDNIRSEEEINRQFDVIDRHDSITNLSVRFDEYFIRNLDKCSAKYVLKMINKAYELGKKEAGK